MAWVGEIPLMNYAKKNTIKNWSRIANKKCNILLSECYESVIENGLNWTTCIENYITENGLGELFLSRNMDTYAKIFTRTKDIFFQESRSEINSNNSKLRTYSTLKDNDKYEEYLTTIKNIKERTSFTTTRDCTLQSGARFSKLMLKIAIQSCCWNCDSRIREYEDKMALNIGVCLRTGCASRYLWDFIDTDRYPGNTIHFHTAVTIISVTRVISGLSWLCRKDRRSSILSIGRIERLE